MLYKIAIGTTNVRLEKFAAILNFVLYKIAIGTTNVRLKNVAAILNFVKNMF